MHENPVQKTKKFEMPNGLVTLFALLFLVFLLTYILPAGEYTRTVVDGKTIVDPNSFKQVTVKSLSPLDFFKSIPLGLQSASSLIIMILLIGGSIRIFDGSGAIRAAIHSLRGIGKGKNSDFMILTMIMLFFGCLGAFPGMLEAAIPFAPLCVGIALAMGFDLLVGIYIALVPIVAGWSAGVTNPWTTGIGQNLAELTLFSGLGYRFLVFVVFMILTVGYLYFYTSKIKKNPLLSSVRDIDTSSFQNEDPSGKEAFTLRHRLILLIFAATICLIVYGTIHWKWGLAEMSAVYLIGALLGGLCAGYSANKIADELMEGGRSIFIGAMAIGLARGISVIMENGKITDTIVYHLSHTLSGLPAVANAIGLLVIQTVINFFIPSGSGQAMVTLPILLPVSDLVGVSRQICILAFQFGDGLSNLIYPTVGALIAFLAYTKVPFPKWLKFILPYYLLTFAAGAVFLAVAVLINFS